VKNTNSELELSTHAGETILTTLTPSLCLVKLLLSLYLRWEASMLSKLDVDSKSAGALLTLTLMNKVSYVTIFKFNKEMPL